MKASLLIFIVFYCFSIQAKELTEKIRGVWHHAGQYCSTSGLHIEVDYKIEVLENGNYFYKIDIEENCVLKKSGVIENPQNEGRLVKTCLTAVEVIGEGCSEDTLEYAEVLKQTNLECFESFYLPSDDNRTLLIVEPMKLEGLICPQGENLIQNFKRY